MDDTSIQQKIVELARRFGLNPGQLTSAQYTRFSLMARSSVREKLDAARSAMGSLARTKLLGIRVAPDVAASNKATCLKCPDSLFQELKDGSPSCGGCGCSGRFLISKWTDPRGKCPKGHWSNAGMPTVNGKSIEDEKSATSGGDASGSGKVV